MKNLFKSLLCCFILSMLTSSAMVQKLDSVLFGAVFERSFARIHATMVGDLFDIKMAINTRQDLLRYYRGYGAETPVSLGFNSKMLPLRTIRQVWDTYIRARIGVLALYISNSCYQFTQENAIFHKNNELYFKTVEKEFAFEHYWDNRVKLLETTLFSATHRTGLDKIILDYKNALNKFWQDNDLTGSLPIAIVSFIANWKTHIIVCENRTRVLLIPDFSLEPLREICAFYPRTTILSTAACLQEVDAQLLSTLDKGKIETMPSLESAFGYLYALEITRRIRESSPGWATLKQLLS